MIRLRSLTVILVGASLFAQQPPAGAGKSNLGKAMPAKPSQPAGLTVEGILAMVAAALSDDVIIARLRKQDRAFDLSSDEMIRLKKAKVSDTV